MYVRKDGKAACASSGLVFVTCFVQVGASVQLLPTVTHALRTQSRACWESAYVQNIGTEISA